jgi:diguanylate cyclase (GGDEF)-like protein
VPIAGVALLHALVGVSFVLCAAVIAWDGNWVLPGPLNNWAEDLGLVVALVGMTGIGALSLALNQWRLATRHRQDALTDPLTGLLNRRALFEAYGRGALADETVVVVFDLDRFKSINDQHGHAVGDAVLRRFGETLLAHSRPGDSVARLGGEEFVLILPATPQPMAAKIAERIRRRFEAESFPAATGLISCTVSAGLALPTEAEPDFEATLNAADHALYLAKSTGRNRIVPATRLLAS